MKIIITTFTIAAITLLAAAPQAQAGRCKKNRVYVSEHRSCRAPVYAERYLIGYDECGNPVWGSRNIRREYRPVVVQERYIAPCPRPYYQPRPQYSNHYQRPYYGNGFSIQANFGR